MRIEDNNSSTETVPLADLAAEAANEGSPAQTMPETLPPQARRKRADSKGNDESSQKPDIKQKT